MKNLLLIFSVLLSTSLSAVEYGNIMLSEDELSSNSIVLNEGDIFEILSNTGIDVGLLDFSNVNPVNTQNYRTNGWATAYGVNRIFCGPIRLTFSAYNHNASSYKAYLGYKLTRASEIEYKQVNIVSLPLDDVGNGTHNIVVEASDDLQSWTPVHSSSIGGDKAFFRTRVVEAE